jgi:DNA-binding CsgD family transcriptional regulator
MGGEQKAKPYEKQRQALALRAEGHTYRQIADEMGYSVGGAYKAVQSALQKIRAEGVAELRALENERLDQLLQALWPAATSGKAGAVRAALAILERRAKLWGLDAPTRYEIDSFLRSGDWLTIKAALKEALDEYPDAAEAVARALRRIAHE